MKVVVSAVAFSKNKELVQALLNQFPDAVINYDAKRYVDAELVEYYKEADAIITGLERIDDELLSKLPKLKLIAKYGVGLDNIDIEACKNRNVKIGWTGGVNKHSVAEMALGLLLMLSRNLFTTANQLKSGTWNKSGGFSLSSRTIGIIGIGHIGKELVQMLKPFNCRILVNDVIDLSDFAHANNVESVTKEYLFQNSDIISVHTPLNASTKDMINKETILQMKQSVFLINTARGGIVNEEDLKWALSSNRIGGAALDVFNVEPPEDTELICYPNIIATPHIAGNSYEAVIAMGLAAINHIVSYKNNL
jgi:phosphoglycerate dehydrogenase-like enzyme